MNTKKADTNTFFSKYGLLIILAALIFFFSMMSDTFFTPLNFGNVAITNVAAGLLALGAMFIVVMGEFDLSLGYNLMFSMCVGAKLILLGVPLGAAIVLMIGAGTLFGFLNGIMVVRLGVSAYIATLASGLAMNGLAQAITGGSTLKVALGETWITFSTGKIGQVGYSVIFWLLLCLAVFYLMNYTLTGRHLFAVGDNPRTAFLAGIKADKMKILAFTMAGLFAGIAAFVYLGQIGTANTSYGTSLLLPAYTMVFLSTAVFKPGTVNVQGLVVAIFFVAIGSNGMKIMGAPVWSSNVYEGVILIVALLISNYFKDRGRHRKLLQSDLSRNEN